MCIRDRNPAIRKRMLKGGVLENNLPTPDALDKYRMKAARSNALAFRALFYFNKIDSGCFILFRCILTGFRSAGAELPRRGLWRHGLRS